MGTRKALVFSNRQMRRVDEILLRLREVSGSRFIALVSTSGQPITSCSLDVGPDSLSLASLAASSFAATQQLAEILAEKEFTLLFHEGRDSNLHVAPVTERVLLVLTFGRDTQLGRVRLYTSRAVEALAPIFVEAELDEEDLAIDKDYSARAGQAIEDLFVDVE